LWSALRVEVPLFTNCLKRLSGNSRWHRFRRVQAPATGRKGAPFGARRYRNTLQPTRPASLQTVSRGSLAKWDFGVSDGCRSRMRASLFPDDRSPLCPHRATPPTESGRSSSRCRPWRTNPPLGPSRVPLALLGTSSGLPFARPPRCGEVRPYVCPHGTTQI
jgi:hypothetical protein